MQFVFDRGYDFGRWLPVRTVHGFRLDRPSQTRRLLQERYGVTDERLRSPARLTSADVERVHPSDHLAALRSSAALARGVELPALALVPGSVARSAVLDPQVLAAGGTARALEEAIDGAWMGNLSGGFHHAWPNLAHGFCLIADVAVAIERLRVAGRRPRVVIIDLDAHQGDGNAVAFANDPDVLTISVHEQDIFPDHKPPSDLDVGLPAGAEDDAYLAAVRAAVDPGEWPFLPDALVYVSGVDVHADDGLSTLQVTASGVVARDLLVADVAAELGCGLVMLPGGGYTPRSPELVAAGMAAVAQRRERV